MRWNVLVLPMAWLALSPTALSAVVLIQSLTGPQISGSFVFGGSLAADGEFQFGSDGSPASNSDIDAEIITARNYSLSSSGTLAGTFSMSAAYGTGTFGFSSDGSPLSAPQFTTAERTFSNLPNQNDHYLLSEGVISAVKYDLSASGRSLSLNSDNTYTVTAGAGGSTVESGSYSIAQSSVTTATATFTNLPNSNDRYVVSDGSVTAVKFDLSTSGYSLQLRTDGTFSLTGSGLTSPVSGTYQLTTVPEPNRTLIPLAFVMFGTAIVRGARGRPGESPAPTSPTMNPDVRTGPAPLRVRR